MKQILKSKKGAVVLFFMIIGMLAAIGYLFYLLVTQTPSLEFVGKTQASILNTYEFSERTFLYIDITSEFASKLAVQNILKSSGYSEIIMAYVTDQYKCGKVVYPIFNNESDVDTCIPDYETAFIEEFKNIFENMIGKYKYQRIRSGDFSFKTTKTVSGDLILLMDGISPLNIPLYSDSESYYVDSASYFDRVTFLDSNQKELVDIRGIPNIVCIESAEPKAGVTDFGRICKANAALVEQLKLISQNELVPNGMTMIITQAFRTYEIQKSLREKFGSKACNPDLKICSHVSGGAIDINIFQGGVNLNKANPGKVESLMCAYDFVRLHFEDWHFEYGTPAWENTQSKRELGQNVCTY